LGADLAQIRLERAVDVRKGPPMKLRMVGLAALVFGIVALADDGDRAKLMGGWESQSGTGSNRETWLLEPRATRCMSPICKAIKKLAEFECDTDGKDCATKVAGTRPKYRCGSTGRSGGT